MELSFEFLDNEVTKILQTNYKNLILLIGNTGSGKSTISQFVGGDNNKLTSVKTEEGSFIIEDNDSKISSSVQSKTLYPELVIVNNTEALCDCPGFNDTRDAKHDIAATYFTKNVIDHAERVKFVFVVSHHAVQKGVDRRDFVTLLKFVTTLIKNVDQFKEGFGLIVTKVQNIVEEDDEGVYKLIPDAMLINGIAEFLRTVKESLTSNEDQKFAAGASQIIESLLCQRNNNYIRIGILRRPNRPGPVTNIPLLQGLKENLKNLLFTNTSFIPKKENDFGYAISESSLNFVHTFVDAINTNISQCSQKVGNTIQEYYRDLFQNSNDIHKLQIELDKGYNIWQRITENVGDSEAAESYCRLVLDALAELSPPSESFLKAKGLTDLKSSCKNEFDGIIKQGKLLQFLKIISNKEFKTRALDWLQPYRATVSIISDFKIWNQFLIDLQLKLSEYDIQKKKDIYNVSDVSNWGISGNRQGIFIDQNNFKLFLEKANEINRTQYTYNDSELELKIKGLNDVLKITLLSEETITSPQRGTLVVKGEIIKLSTVVNNYQFSDATRIEILALNTVYIDEDVHRIGDEIELVIIAPKWVVIGTREINLDGEAGSAHSQSVASGNNAGIPGLPGGPGGRFFGVGAEFIDGDSLVITANGGNGGPGQTGASGKTGNNGQDPCLPEATYGWLFTSDGLKDLSFRYEVMGPGEFSMPLLIDLRSEIVYKIHGTYGSSGSKGYDGGVGGEGGSAGCVMIYHENSEIRTSAESGSCGTAGSGGNGGLGGLNGDDIMAVLTNSALLIPITGIHKKWIKVETHNNGRASSGPNGTSGVNDAGLVRARSSSYVAEPEVYLNDMKSYLNEFKNNWVKKHNLEQFDSFLENNSIYSFWRGSADSNSSVNSDNDSEFSD